MRCCGPRSDQRGAALIVALMMLVAVLAIGMTAAQVSLQGEKAARNERDRQIAFQAAEAALLDAETDIESGTRAHLFAHDSMAGFVAGCGSAGESLGLCLRGDQAVPVWQSVDFLQEQGPSVAYGSFTGQVLPVGSGSLPVRVPRYIVEVMPYTAPGGGADEVTYFYRITAIGFGTQLSTQVVLQTFYRKYAQ